MPSRMHETARALERDAATGPSTGRERRPAGSRGPVATLIAQHVVPRLAIAHVHRAVETRPAPDMTGDDKVRRYVDLILGPEIDAALAYVTALRCQGVGDDSICLNLLAPAARCLRAMWNDDACDYGAFKLGVSRLRMILHQLGCTSTAVRISGRSDAVALLVTLPDETATFEHDLVASFFCRSSWLIHNHPAPSTSQLAALARGTWFHVAWISISAGSRREDVASCTRLIRRASQNEAISVLCGCEPMAPIPFPCLVGADAIVPDAGAALVAAKRARMFQLG